MRCKHHLLLILSEKGNRVKTQKLSVVIPCFNEEESLQEMHLRLSNVCSEFSKKIGAKYEIIFVNDGSKDHTWELIRALQKKDPNVVGVNLSRNHGFQAALSAGLSLCTGDRVLILDADLQDPPELLQPMWDLMTSEGAQVVYGQRLSRKGETFLKKITASLFYRFLTWITDVEIPVDTGDFRLMDRKVVDVINSMPEQNRFMRGLISWVGFKHVPIHYHRDERFAGSTKFNYRKMFLFALDGVTSFSIKPLRISIVLGGALIGVSILLGLWALKVSYEGHTVPGWTSMFIIQLVLGSLQLFVLGIIGEYVGRIFLQSKDRPLFIISEVVKETQ